MSTPRKAGLLHQPVLADVDLHCILTSNVHTPSLWCSMYERTFQGLHLDVYMYLYMCSGHLMYLPKYYYIWHVLPIRIWECSSKYTQHGCPTPQGWGYCICCTCTCSAPAGVRLYQSWTCITPDIASACAVAAHTFSSKYNLPARTIFSRYSLAARTFSSKYKASIVWLHVPSQAGIVLLYVPSRAGLVLLSSSVRQILHKPVWCPTISLATPSVSLR